MFYKVLNTLLGISALICISCNRSSAFEIRRKPQRFFRIFDGDGETGAATFDLKFCQKAYFGSKVTYF